MLLQRTRSDSKRQLADSPDFVKARAFDTIARGYHCINMPDLISYLERNSFFPRREDVEAILRRCDHDANRQVSYTEFCEMTCIVDPNVREATAAASGNDEQKNDDGDA